MNLYIKKPPVFEVVQFEYIVEEEWDGIFLKSWPYWIREAICKPKFAIGSLSFHANGHWVLQTPKKLVIVMPDDYLVYSQKEKLRVCSPEVFDQKYISARAKRVK